MQQLYSDRLAPLTSEIEFLECDITTAVDAFVAWQRSIQAAQSVRIILHEVGGDFESRLYRLLPLTNIERRRFLFAPTASGWTAYFDNGVSGTDISPVSHLSRQLKCRAIRTVSVPNSIQQTSSGERGRYGATIFELFEATSEGCSFLNCRRSIGTVNDGGKWCFDSVGEPLKFEQTEQYSAKRIRDKFTSEMLDKYLHNFGIELFSPDFFSVQKPAFLVQKEGQCTPGMREFSLEEARATF